MVNKLEHIQKHCTHLNSKHSESQSYKHTGHNCHHSGTAVAARMSCSCLIASKPCSSRWLLSSKNHQLQPLHCNNHQPKIDGNVNNNNRITRSSFILIETKSTKSSGATLLQVVRAAAPDDAEGVLPHILPARRHPNSTILPSHRKRLPHSKPIKVTK